MTWAPNVPTEEEIEGFVEDLMATTPEILGIDETLPGCEIIDMDPYGVGAGTLPRYIQVAIREYYQAVYYRGFPAGLVATDVVTVVHLREGNRYEVLTAGGSAGIAHTVAAGQWLDVGVVTNSLDFEPDNPAVVTAGGVVTEYATIQAAITAAGAGEYVVIPPGTYDEAITLKNGVIVTELFPDTVVIDHTTSDVAVTTAAGGFLRVKEIRVTRANNNIRAVLSGHAAGICVIYARLIRAANAGTGGTIGVFQTGAGTLFIYCDDCQASGGDAQVIGAACDAGIQYLRGDCLAENGTASYSVGAECNGGTQRVWGDCKATDDDQVVGAYAIGAGDQIVRGHCTAETAAAGSWAVGAWIMNAGTVQVVHGECSGLAVDDAMGASIYQGTQTIHGNCFAECTGSPANSYGARVRANSTQTIWGNCTATGGTVSIGAYCQAWTGTPIQRVNGDVTGDFHGASCSAGTQTITNGRASGATADLEWTGGTLQAFSVQHDTVVGTITWLDGDALESLRDYTQGSIIYGGAADWQDLVVGGIGDFLWVNAAGTEPEWHTLVAGDIPAHALLGAQHSDTTTDAPTRGSLIVANATPLWDELLHPLAAGYALITSATDTVWDQTPAWTGRHSFAAGITFNGGAGINSVVIPDALADAFDITNGVEFLRLDTASDYFLIDPAGAGVKVAIGLAIPNQVLTVEGTIDLKEQAAANPSTAAYGQIWVKTAAPNELWFTDDAGNNVQLGVGGGALPPVAGAGYALISTGVNTWAADLTPLWLGTHTWGSGFSILPTDASGQDLGAAGARWDLYTQDVIFGGATGTNAITVPDNLADALHISDAGGIEYLKIITTDAQPILRFNDGGVDVDFEVEAVGVADALFVQGSTGFVAAGRNAPEGHFDVYDITVNTTISYYGIHNEHVKTLGATDRLDNLEGIHNHIEFDQNGATIGYLNGINNRTILTSGSVGDGGVRDMRGIYNYLWMEDATCTVTDDVQGILTFIDLNGGTVGDDIAGHHIYVNLRAAMASIGGDVYGIYLYLHAGQDPVGTAYSIYWEEGTNIDYGIYQNGMAPNLFGGDVDPANASGQDLGDATHRWDLYTQDIIFGGATGANVITVPDNIADALGLLDAGGLEYMRIVSTNANPYFLIDPGDTGINVGIGTATPAYELDIADAADNTILGIYTYSITDTDCPSIFFFKSHHDTLGTLAATTDGEYLGNMRFYGVDTGSAWAYGARLYAIQRGAAGASYVETDMIFETYSTSALNIYQLVLDGGTGNVGIGAIPNQQLTVEGTVDLKEQAAANADTAAYGQIWVKTAVPNELWFTDDAGTDVQLGIGAWVLISETILLAGAASVTFAAIPQIYRSLVLQCQARTDRAAENDVVFWRANGDAANNYDQVYFYGRGDGALLSGCIRGTSSGRMGFCEAANSRASNFSPTQCWFSGYALTDREKYGTSLAAAIYGDVSGNADVYTNRMDGRWRSTAAITSLTLFPATGPNFVTGSRFTLYGIL